MLIDFKVVRWSFKEGKCNWTIIQKNYPLRSKLEVSGNGILNNSDLEKCKKYLPENKEKLEM